MSAVASMDTSVHSRGSQQNKKHTRRLGVRIDMTPMVDVAFLLMTFFMLTTTLLRHQAMEINIPSGPLTPVSENDVLTLLVNNENVIFWNIGRDIPVRVAINDLKDLLIRQNRQNSKLITLLKIDRKARYRSLVDLLDELQESNVGSYSIAPLEEKDREILRTISS